MHAHACGRRARVKNGPQSHLMCTTPRRYMVIHTYMHIHVSIFELCTHTLAADELGSKLTSTPSHVHNTLAFTRYAFSYRPLYTNQYYYSQIPPLFGHPTPPLHR